MKIVEISFEDLLRVLSKQMKIEDSIAYLFDGVCVAKNGEIQPFLCTVDQSNNIKIRSLDTLTNDELLAYHKLCHSIENTLHSPEFCSLHYKIVVELLNRGVVHSGDVYCDRVVDLIKGSFEDYISSIKSLKDQTLLDDFRIVCSWYSSIKDGKVIHKRINGESKEITLDDLKRVAVEIAKEMARRNFNFSDIKDYKENIRELIEYVFNEIGINNTVVNVQDITIEYLESLTDKDLNNLWNWLHDKWKKDFPNGEVTEDFLNANIFIQTERFKRHLIDLDYEDKDELDRQSRMSWQEYKPTSIENSIVTLEQVLDLLRENGQIIIKGEPYLGYLSGRIVNEGKIDLNSDSDIDIAIEGFPDERIVQAFNKIKPDWLAKKIHVFFTNNAGEIGYAIPLYSMSFELIPKQDMIKQSKIKNVNYFTSVSVGKYVIGVKPKSGFGKYEFWDVNDCWRQWGSYHLPCIIEEKVDGRRFQVHIDNDKVEMISEDTQRDRSSLFPELVEEFKLLGVKSAILDGDIVAFDIPNTVNIKNAKSKRKLGDLIEREDTAIITAGTNIPSEFRNKIVYVIYDILYLNGKDLSSEPYAKRREIYSGLVSDKLKYIDIVNGVEAKTLQEFLDGIDTMRDLNGSEGAVIKDVNFAYPIKYSGENRTDDMCKIKNLKEIDVIVLDVIRKKTKEGKELDTYMYDCGVLIPDSDVGKYSIDLVKKFRNNYYLKIGRTYSTNVKCDIGDIITVRTVRIREYQDKYGKLYLTWMFPLFVEKKKNKTEADTIDTAYKILQAKTKPLDKAQLVEIKLDLCKYANSQICPLRRRFKEFRYNLDKIIVEKEFLKYPVCCPLSQIYKCKYLKPYYYSVKRFAEYDLDLSILDANAFPKKLRNVLLAKYMECPKGIHKFVIQSHILTSEFVPKEKKIPDQGSQHLDFRFSMNGYLEGWSIVGGSVSDMITIKKLMEFGKGFRAEEKAQQPKDWLFENMTPIGQRSDDLKPNDTVPEMYDVIVGEGEPRGKMYVITRGELIFGVQKPYFHEYFIRDGEFFKDWVRVIVRAINVADDRNGKSNAEIMWRFMIPKDQMPYTISNRAMSKNWKPDKSNPTPFPIDWVKQNFKDQYEKWIQWISSNKLSLGEVVISVHSYRGPIHNRAMFVRDYYVFLSSGDMVRGFLTNINPLLEKSFFAIKIDKVTKSIMEFEGITKPQTFFNKNKKLEGNVQILYREKADVSINVENGIETIEIKFDKGTIILEQEDKHSDIYNGIMYENKLSLVGMYDYQKHTINNKTHYDLILKLDNYDHLIEISLPKPLDKIDRNETITTVKFSNTVNVNMGVFEKLHCGSVEVFSISDNSICFKLISETTSDYYSLSKNKLWQVRKSIVSKF